MFKFITIVFTYVLLSLGTAYSQTFPGSGGVIPDAGPQTCFSIPVSGVGFVNSSYGLTSVCININHNWDSDLEIILKAPDGTSVQLSSQNGGSGVNYAGTCFSANASTPISSGAAPFLGTYLPQGYLGNVNNGQNADGDWSLCIQDLTINDSGSLVSWSLNFSNAPAPPPPGCSSNTTASNTCATAPSICNFNGFCGTTSAVTAPDTWPELTAAFCGGAIENNSFVKFTASSSAASFNVWVTNSLNALGIQMMVFDGGCGSGPVTAHGCNNRIFPTSSGPSLLTATGLVPGNSYYIMMDGYLGDVCDYIIVAASGVNILNVVPASPQLCPGESVVLSASGGNGIYSWSPAVGLSSASGAAVTARPDTTTIYSVTSTAIGSCPLVNFFTVNVNPKPDFGADKIVNICTGASLDLNREFPVTGLSTSWTKGGVAVANPSAVNTPGVYKLIGKNPNRCNDTALLTLNIVSKPNLGADKVISICPGNSVNLSTQFVTTGLMPVWTLSGTAVSNPASVNTSGQYQLIAFNGSDCSDTALVTVIIKPSPQLGQDKIVNLCPGTSVDLTALYTTTGYTTSWTFGGNPVANPSNVTVAGTYKLIATNGVSCSDTAMVTMSYHPSLLLGPDKNSSICTGNFLDLTAEYNTAGITTNWTFAGNPVAIPTAVNTPGVYKLIAVNGSTCRDTALLTLSISPKPFLGNDTLVNLCTNGTYNLNAVFNISGLTAVWTRLDTLVANPSAITTDGPYVVIAKTASGCADTAQVIVVIRPKPDVGADVVLSICPYVIVNLNNQLNTVGFTNTWTLGGVSVPNPSSISQAGNYKLVASNAYGCKDTGLVTIFLSRKPDLGADKTVAICNFQSVNLSTLYTTTGYIATWTLGGIQIPTYPVVVSTPGLYQLVISNGTACTDSALVTLATKPNPHLGTDTTINTCYGNTINLNTVFDTTGLASRWYYFGFLVNNTSVVSTTGIYQLVATNSFTCTDTAFLHLNIYVKPNLGPDKNLSVCTGTLFDLTTQFNTAGTTTATWTKGGLPVANPTQVSVAGVYQLIVENTWGCKDTAFINLSVTSTLNLGSDTAIALCQGGKVNLNSIYPTSGLTTAWTLSNVAVANPAAVSVANTYRLVANNGPNCVDTIFVTLVPKLNPNIGADKSAIVCQYNYFDLTTQYVTNGLTTDWSFAGVPVDNPSTTVAPGIYEIHAQDSFGCADTAKLTLSLIANPFIGNDWSIGVCPNKTINLTSKFNTTGLTQSWTFLGNPVPNPTSVSDTGNYQLIATSPLGCKDTAFLRVVQFTQPELGPNKTVGICLTDTADLVALFGTDYATYYYTIWTIGGVPVANPRAVVTAGIYQLNAAYRQGCYDTTYINVSYNPKPNLGPDKSINICPGSSIGLNVQFLTTGLSTYWTFGGLPVVDSTAVTAAGNYQVIATNSTGCMDTAFVNILVLTKPNLGVDKKLIVCDGTVVNLTAQYNTTGLTTSYTLLGIPVADPAAVTAAGNYQVIATNNTGCNDTAIITIILLPKPSLGADKADSICPGMIVNLHSFYDTTGLVTHWVTGGLPVATPSSISAGGLYQVKAVNDVGCHDTAFVSIFIKSTSASTTNVDFCRNRLPFVWNGNNYFLGGTYTDTLTNAAGCDSVASLVFTIKDTTTSTTNKIVCNNQLPYQWNGNNYAATGIYTARLINSAGCDSAATLNLIVKDTTTSITPIIVCNNQLPYVWNGNNYSSAGTYSRTFTNVAGCDSVAVLNLVINDTSVSTTSITICNNQLPYQWNGNNYPAAGIYAFRLNNAAGCDSIATLQLTVSDTSFSNNSATICNNQLPYQWNGNNYTAAGNYEVRLVNAVGCDSVAKLALLIKDTTTSITPITVCNNQLPYNWNGNNYSVTGNYTANFINAAGCDSIAMLSLTVKDTTTSITPMSVCNNQLPYQWNGNNYSLPGDYTVNLNNAAGCDSVATLRLTVIDTTFSSTPFSICNNQLPYAWNGNNYTATGTYAVRLVNAAGCDSIATLLLLVKDTSFSNYNAVVCNNQLPYQWNGNNYSLPGNYKQHFINAAGCDSVAKLSLTIKDTSFSISNISVCNNQLPYSWNGNNYSSSGTYSFTTVNAADCDSVAKLNLTVNAVSFSYTPISICPGQLPYLWNGIDCAAAGTYIDTLTNFKGCDSVATLILTVKANSSSSTPISICSNQLPYSWNGNNYSATGSYTVTLANAAGCDSAATLVLNVKQTSASTDSVSICPSQLPFAWNGNLYLAAGNYTTTFVNAVGCDSVVTLVLFVKLNTSSITRITICPNQLPYSWNGSSFPLGGLYSVTLTNAAGCDSIATLVLTVNQNTSSINPVSICSSQLPYAWNGNNYTTAGSYPVHLTNAGGCDSLATLMLTVNTSSSSTDTVNICSNQLPYYWNGNFYVGAGSYNQTFTNAAGCDSVATLVITLKNNSSSNITVSVCENLLPYFWNGSLLTIPGSYSKTFSNANGCDSVATITMNVLATSKAAVSQEICANQLPLLWNGKLYSAAGVYTATRNNATGCDSIITLTLTVNPVPARPNLGNDTLICPNDKILLNAGSNYSSYLWQDNSTGAAFEVQGAGYFTVQVTNNFGCINRDEISVSTLSNCDDIYFPNAFSPNGDGKNEGFSALGNLFLVKDYSLSIYNRYGKMVFATNNPYQKWDGTISGTKAPPANYVWKAIYNYRGKVNKTRSGNLLLIR